MIDPAGNAPGLVEASATTARFAELARALAHSCQASVERIVASDGCVSDTA